MTKIPDYKDLAVEELSDCEAELQAQIDRLEIDVAAWRTVARRAIHNLHDITRERDRARARIVGLTDELRALRAAQRERRAA